MKNQGPGKNHQLENKSDMVVAGGLSCNLEFMINAHARLKLHVAPSSHVASHN